MMPLVGMVFRGYCGGAFGGFTDAKRVEAFGADWIVVRNSDGAPNFATFMDTADMMASVQLWANEKGGWE